jgi:hypothetical protein
MSGERIQIDHLGRRTIHANAMEEVVVCLPDGTKFLVMPKHMPGEAFLTVTDDRALFVTESRKSNAQLLRKGQ